MIYGILKFDIMYSLHRCLGKREWNNVGLH